MEVFKNCRDDWIRTSDPTHPMRVRYRAAPHPEVGGKDRECNLNDL